MLKTLRCYVWVFVFILILYPYTSITGSDTPSAGEIWKEPVTGMEFVWVPGGCYEMGCGSWTNDCSSDEKPVHEVCVDGFWMGKTEVTQGQWKQIMGDNPAMFKKGDNYPLENALYEEMEKFMNKLSTVSKGAYVFRFPTEAEWEYASRSGGKPEKYAGGSDLNQVAWYSGNSDDSTHAVATKAPNGLGLFDMNGNVHSGVRITIEFRPMANTSGITPYLGWKRGILVAQNKRSTGAVVGTRSRNSLVVPLEAMKCH